jgi:hypothetical protein
MKQSSKNSGRPLKLPIGPVLSPFLGAAARIITADAHTIVAIAVWPVGFPTLRYLFRTTEVAEGQNFITTVFVRTTGSAPMNGIMALLTGIMLKR